MSEKEVKHLSQNRIRLSPYPPGYLFTNSDKGGIGRISRMGEINWQDYGNNRKSF